MEGYSTAHQYFVSLNVAYLNNAVSAEMRNPASSHSLAILGPETPYSRVLRSPSLRVTPQSTMDIGDKHCRGKSGLRSGNEVKDDIKNFDPISEKTAEGPITRKYYPSVVQGLHTSV